MTPKEKAHQQINAQLTASGWFVRDSVVVPGHIELFPRCALVFKTLIIAKTRFVIVNAVGVIIGRLGGGDQPRPNVSQLQSLLYAA